MKPSAYCFGRLRPFSRGVAYCFPHRDIPVEAERDLDKYIRQFCTRIGYNKVTGTTMYWHRIQQCLYTAEIVLRY